jgi:hypothetical protein
MHQEEIDFLTTEKATSRVANALEREAAMEGWVQELKIDLRAARPGPNSTAGTGAISTLIRDGITRAPCLRFSSAQNAARAKLLIEDPVNMES